MTEITLKTIYQVGTDWLNKELRVTERPVIAEGELAYFIGGICAEFDMKNETTTRKDEIDIVNLRDLLEKSNFSVYFSEKALALEFQKEFNSRKERLQNILNE